MPSVAIQTNQGTDALTDPGTTGNYAMTFSAGTNLAMVCLIGWSGPTGLSISSVVWDSAGANQALSLIPGTRVTDFGTSLINTALYGLVNPTPGTAKNLTVTLSGSGNTFRVSAIIYSGVNQTGGATSFPHGTTVTSTGNPSVSVTTQTGNYIVGMCIMNNPASDSPNQTVVFNDAAGASNAGFGNTTPGATGAATLSGTSTAGTDYGYSACDVMNATPFVPIQRKTFSQFQTRTGTRQVFDMSSRHENRPSLILPERKLIIPGFRLAA